MLGGFLIDLVAMIFGMRRALFPVLAATTFHAGAGGLGLLFAAPAVGAVAAALSSGWLSRRSRLGTVIVVSVAVWGASVAGFGLVSSLWPALALLAVGGAADTYSAVCRSTMLQTITPDELRGRLSSVYFMVVVGNRCVPGLAATMRTASVLTKPARRTRNWPPPEWPIR